MDYIPVTPTFTNQQRNFGTKPWADWCLRESTGVNSRTRIVIGVYMGVSQNSGYLFGVAMIRTI